MNRLHTRVLDFALLDTLWATRKCHGMFPEIQSEVVELIRTRQPSLAEIKVKPIKAHQIPYLIFTRESSLWIIDESSSQVGQARCIDGPSIGQSIEPLYTGYRISYDYDDIQDRLYAFDSEFHRVFIYNFEKPTITRTIHIDTPDEFGSSSKFRCLDGFVFLAYINTTRMTALRCIDLENLDKEPNDAKLIWSYDYRFYGNHLRDFIVTRVAGEQIKYNFTYICADEVISVLLRLEDPINPIVHGVTVSYIPRGHTYIKDIRLIKPGIILVIDSSHPEGFCYFHLFELINGKWISCDKMLASSVRGLYEVVVRPDGCLFSAFLMRGTKEDIVLKNYECVWS